METIAAGIMDSLNDLEGTGFAGEGLRRVIEPVMEPAPLTEHRPWHDWQEPTVLHQSLHMLRLDVATSPVEEKPFLNIVGPDGPLGRCTHGLLTGLAEFTTFPSEFVEKLSPRLACAVVNERIGAARTMETAIIVVDGEAKRLTEGSRGIVPAGMLAEFVDDWSREQFGASQIEQADYDGQRLRLWINLPVEEPVTRRVGDVLRAGFVVEQDYGEPISVSLGTTRLICLNGMTANRALYSWRCRDSRDIDSQLAWVAGALDGCFHSFLPLVERAKRMAEARFFGDYHAVLRNSARAMRLPNRYIPDLIAAFEEEPGDTHWHLSNAFTRLATHGSMPSRNRYAMMDAAGDWVNRFQLCTAELPLPMATLVGARVIEDKAA